MDGACVVSNGDQTDPGTDDCQFRQVKVDGKCVNVNDLCASWDEATAACTSCYGGYTLADGQCKL